MSKKTNESPFQALEQEAYHAFREWPIWLVLRERELSIHLAAARPANVIRTAAKAQQQHRDSRVEEQP